MKNDVIALVPMKACSERVKNKNLRNFHGKPLLTYILETLLQVEIIKLIVVNTDSEKIADIVSRYERTIIHPRPKYICGNHISMNKIIEHDISLIDGDHFLQTHATNPLLRDSTITDACSVYFNSLTRNDSLVSVTEFKGRFYNSYFSPINHDPLKLTNTQDIDPVYEENSNIYIFSRKSFDLAKNRIGPSPLYFPISKIESVDIDDENDFLMAESLYKKSKIS